MSCFHPWRVARVCQQAKHDETVALLKAAMAKDLEEARRTEAQLRDAHRAATEAVEAAEAKAAQAQRAMETAKQLAHKSLQQTLQGKMSVSVLAPSVKVSFGGNKDLHVLPDAPRELIENVLKQQVRVGG
jgi:hypothetical protein